MELVVAIIVLAAVGALIGGLGRLALPGPDPMTLGQTILVGIGGSLLAGFVVAALSDGEAAPTMLSSVLGATFIVWLIRRSRRRRAGV